MVSETIRRQVQHLTGDETDKQINIWSNTRATISDAAAVTVASWWQSPGGIGHVLAGFASGSEVSREELSDDIDRTIGEHPENGYLSELHALRAWLMVQP